MTLESPARDSHTALFDLEGRSAVVTGATGALGRAAAEVLATAGARVTLAGAANGELEALAHELDDGGGNVATIARRPRSEEDAAAIVAEALRAHGRLDFLVVASGMNVVHLIGEFAVEEWDAVIDANVRGPWLMCRAAAAPLIANGRGSVVLVSSTRGRLGHPAGYSAYVPSKHAVEGLTRTLACEWGPCGVRVNAIGPSVFRSALTAWMYREDEKATATREAMLARIPLGRLAEPSDLVGTLIFLLSDASSFITGQVIYVDGGYTAG
jgi:NAD(P)-dependent dehydrogenase (short-subunit alcohol dehydrogenase family)